MPRWQPHQNPGTNTRFIVLSVSINLNKSLASNEINNNHNETRNDSAHSNDTKIRETEQMSGDGRTVDERQNVRFLNQGQDAGDQSLSLPTTIKNSYRQMAMHDKQHTLKDFLERPVRIWNGTFPTSATANQQLMTARFPDILLQNRMYNEKIRGFVGLRPKAVEVRVQVNAQKFQQGRLRLQYIPYAKYLPNKVSLLASSLTTRTSCPGVDIDICGGSTPTTRVAQAVFTIPYVSPHLFFNMINGDGTMGDIYLFVYSPLVSGSSEASDCEVTIWARFIDPVLEFPTGATPLYTIPSTMKQHEAQVAGEAKKIATRGVISDTLGVIAETLSTAKKIPVIGEYLAIPEWLARTGTNILQMFGFCKPTLPMDTKLRTANCLANFNGKDSSHKMALSAENEIDTPNDLSGTALDEMALSTIYTTPAYWSSFNWTTSQTTEDQILWTDFVSPFKFSPISGGNTYSMLPMCYVANCFGSWRGSLVYTFKVVKTGFHAGRLRIFFTPYESSGNLVVGNAPTNEIEKNYQIVFDIEENDVVSFTVPYVSTKPWLATTNQTSSQSPVAVSTGYVVVCVLNELKAVSTVSPSIQVLVEVSGGPDLTFAMPCAPRMQPALPAGAVSFEEVKEHEAQVFGTELQQERNEAHLLNAPESISALNPMSNWSPEAHCIGEKVVSVRQLIKRNNFVGLTQNNRTSNADRPQTSTTLDFNTFTSINPYGFKIQDLQLGLDYLSYFSMVYAFFRGGIRLKISSSTFGADGHFANNDTPNGVWYSTPKALSQVFVRMFNAYDQLHGAVRTATRRINNVIGKCGINAVTIGTANALLTDSNSTTVVSQNIEGLIEVEVPYYNTTHLSPTSLVIRTNPSNEYDTTQIFPGTSDTDDAYPLPIVLMGIPPGQIDVALSDGSNSATLTTSYMTINEIYRSAADDFSFSSLIGIPPMVLANDLSSSLFQPQTTP